MHSDPSVRAARVKPDREFGCCCELCSREFKIGLALTFDLAESLVGESVKEEIERKSVRINEVKEVTQSNHRDNNMKKDREHNTRHNR